MARTSCLKRFLLLLIACPFAYLDASAANDIESVAEPANGIVSSAPDNAAIDADELPAQNSGDGERDKEDTADFDSDQDDTADIDTETTVDMAEGRRGVGFDGDFRPTYEYFNVDPGSGGSIDDGRLGFRLRLRADAALTEAFHVGARVAALCFTDECDPEWVMQSTTPTPNGLAGGQSTLDELFMQWYGPNLGSIAIGRLQTRAVLRGGVYAKSLDRNDSNNVNVTWTDGMQLNLRSQSGWRSNFIVQRNAEDGTGSIRRGPLDFDDDAARNTYFLGFENIRNWGPVVQRSLDVSYLPSSLLKDGDAIGRREDYWGVVGRLAFRWPQRTDRVRLRAGAELGYAPTTETPESAGLPGDVDGLAWNLVASVMDFLPNNNVGINYGRTGAGWYLSPQFRPNEELFEIRYQYDRRPLPLVELRVRWRQELEQRLTSPAKAEVVDLYLRLTWQFRS